jgi:hypothetical protein
MTTNEYFIITVWPMCFDKIGGIKKLISENYKIIKDMELKFNIPWGEMVRGVYADDRVKEKNILAKIDVFSKFPQSVYLIYINVPKPKYRFKADGRKLSTAMEKLKKKIRDHYGTKKDPSKNPLHIVDEYAHSVNYDNFLKRLL